MVPDTRNREDAILAVKVQKGDREAFARIVELFQNRIYSFCYQFFRDRDIAADAAQETFLRAYRHIKRYDSRRKFSTWIYSIAKNICIDEKRKLDRTRSNPLVEGSPVDLPPGPQGRHHLDPSRISLHMEDRILLADAVARLPDKYRTVIILCYFQELSYQETADILGLTLNLVKVRIFRAKKQLLEILREREAEDE